MAGPGGVVVDPECGVGGVGAVHDPKDSIAEGKRFDPCCAGAFRESCSGESVGCAVVDFVVSSRFIGYSGWAGRNEKRGESREGSS